MEQPNQFDFPNITQSWLHMMLVYYALRLEIAVGVLRDCPRDQWPRYWYRNMTMDLECAGWVVAAYAGRQSVPAPTPRNWFKLVLVVAEVEMARVIQGAESLDRDILAPLGKLLPAWRHNHSWPTFGMDNPWWSYPLREFVNYDEYHTTDKKFERAHNYFNGMWPKSPSPLDQAHNLRLDHLSDTFLDEMYRTMKELRATEAEMRDSLAEVEYLTKFHPAAP